MHFTWLLTDSKHNQSYFEQDTVDDQGSLELEEIELSGFNDLAQVSVQQDLKQEGFTSIQLIAILCYIFMILLYTKFKM